MAVKAIDIYEIRDYISKYDKEDPKTIFKLGVLDSRIRAEVEDEVAAYEVSSAKSEDRARATLGLNQRALKVVQFGLKGMENFQDKDGNPVKFDTISLGKYGKNYAVVTPQILQMIPFKVIKELEKEILGDNWLAEDEEKN